MKADLISNPPPLSFGEGEDQFKLHLRRFTSDDRLAIVDAASRGLVHVQNAANKLVITWENVVDPSGNPIPFARMNERGEQVSNLPAFLGSLPLEMHVRVLAGLLAFVGIPTADVEAIVGPLAVREKPTSPPTPPAGGATPPTASTGS